MSTEEAAEEAFRALDKFKKIRGGDAERERAAADAVLGLDLARTVPDGVERAQLVQALRVAQVALKGERTRAERTAAGATSNALAEAQAEARQLREKLRIAEDELADKRDEIGELTEELTAYEEKDRAAGRGGGRRVSISATGTTAQEQRSKIEELQSELRELRIKKKELMSEAGRKDEIIDARSTALEDLRTQISTEREERRQLEEDVRVMRASLRDYREKLENTNESVAAREERNREGNKQLRQRTREINQLLDENGRLALQLKERDDDLAELAASNEKLRVEKEESDAQAEENMRLVNSLERQVSAAEANEQALASKVEELQAEIDDEEEAQEEEKREYEALIAELQATIAQRGKAIEDRDERIRTLVAEAEKRSESREQLTLRAEIDQLQQKLASKDDEVEALRRGEAEGPARTEHVASAVRAAEAAAAAKALDEKKRSEKIEADLNTKLIDATTKLDAAKKRHTSLSEKFAQREDVIVELRARMDEYERGVHGLREEVQEKERMKALYEQRCDEVKRMTSERNRREGELQELAHEVSWLRDQCDIKPGDPKYMDLSKLKLKSQIEVEQLRSQVMEYEDELQALEQERTLLLKRLRVKALDRGERAARESLPVEKLAALEEMAADLHTDEDFSDRRVAAARLRPPAAPVTSAEAASDAAMSANFLTTTNVSVLQQRGAALQAEVAQKSAALQAAEAGKRKAEREKASLLQDRENLEDTVSALRAQINQGASSGSGSAAIQDAALLQQNHELRAALMDARQGLKDALAASQDADAARIRDAPEPATVHGTTGAPSKAASLPNATGDATSSNAVTAALAATAEQIDDRISTLRKLSADPAATPSTDSVVDGAAKPLIGRPQPEPGAGDPQTPVVPLKGRTPLRPEDEVSMGAQATAKPSVESVKLASRQARIARLGTLERATDQRLSKGLAGVDRSDTLGEGAVVLPDEFSEEAGLAMDPSGRATVDPYDLIAALNAQLLEAKAMLASQQTQVTRTDREIKKYKSEMSDLHEQQTYLYASHVREVRILQKELAVAERRASTAEKQHAEDVVRIESWSTMADALESTGGTDGDEMQRKVGMMGRRLTALRVREMELARQTTVQQAELNDLRSERVSLQDEVRQSQVEAAAEVARLERERRELVARLESSQEALENMAPKADLEAERAAKERYLHAYRSLADQAGRCAGAEANAVRFELETSMLTQRLHLTEAALATATQAAEERAQALEELTKRAGSQGGSKPNVHQLEGRVQSLIISEAGALSRAEAAEKVLDDAMNGRRELSERLASVEEPVAELTEKLRQAEENLYTTRTQLAALKSSASASPGPTSQLTGVAADAAETAQDGARIVTGQTGDDIARLKRELETAKEEVVRAKEYEHIATLQVADLASRQTAFEDECKALREALAEIQVQSDENVATGQLQWAVLQARRTEGEAKRREAAARARQRHVQSALYQLQLATASHEAALFESRREAREAEARCSRLDSDLTKLRVDSVPATTMAKLAEKVREASERAAESNRTASQLTSEREALYTELAAFAARDEDQRALINTIASKAQQADHAHLLNEPPAVAQSAMEEGAQGDAPASSASLPTRRLHDADVVSLITLSAEKTELKVSELRLKRRVASLEVSDLRAREEAKEASSRRELIEEELVRAKEAASLIEHESDSKLAELRSQISQLRLEIQSSKEPIGGKSPSTPIKDGRTASDKQHVSLRQTGHGLVSPPPSGQRSPGRPGSARRGVTTHGGVLTSPPRTPLSSVNQAEPPEAGKMRAAERTGEATPEIAVVEARAEITEMSAQLALRDTKQQEMEAEIRDLRSQLAAVRSELVTSEDSLLRAESRFDLQLAQRPLDLGERPGIPASPYPASPAADPAGSEATRQVQQLLAERADAEARHARKLSLAQESVRSVQEQMRRKDAEVTKLQELLAEVREVNRKDKAGAAATAQALAERLEAQHDDFVQHGFAALAKFKEDAEPVAQGTELSLREIEMENERKEAIITQLQTELSATQAELHASHSHLHDRLGEVDTLRAQLEEEKRRAPTNAMHQRVAQLTASVKSKERELHKLREALATLKEEMEVLAAEHTERMTRVSERAARAEAKAQAEAQTNERMGRLQERLQGLTTEVRAHKQKEDAAKKAAAEAQEAARTAEGLASRASAELARLQSEAAVLKSKLAEAPRREEALKRQLAARTEQLEAMHRGPQPPSTHAARAPPRQQSPSASLSSGEQAAAVAEAVAKAVQQERDRWMSVKDAVEEVQVARSMDDKQKAMHAAQLAHSAAMLQDSERARDAAVQQASEVQAALMAAEAEIKRLQTEGVPTPSTGPASSGVNTAPLPRPNSAAATAEPRTSRDKGVARPTTGSACAPSDGTMSVTASGNAGAASSIAVERWAAEKRLQRKVEMLRGKLSDKTRELSTAEGELAKARNALEGASRREAAMREGMAHAQEQLSRMGRDRESAVAGAMAEMRSREELSAELHASQQQLANAQRELRSARAAAAPASAEATSAEGAGEGAMEDLHAMRATLLQREQQILELGFAAEAHELTISQLQARIRDQSAYQSLFSNSSTNTREPASPPRSSTTRGRASGGRGGENSSVGREELSIVVEKMERVISNLQKENAELRKRAVSNMKYVELTKENKELKASVEQLGDQVNDLTTKLASARADADKATKLARDLAEVRRSLKAEMERSQALRSKLIETQEARVTAEEAAASSGSAAVPAPLLERANAELEGMLKAARAEGRSLRDELVSKGNLLVDVGSQLSEALEAASIAGQRVTVLEQQLAQSREGVELLQQVERERDALANALDERQLEVGQLRGQLERSAESGPAVATANSDAASEAVAAENAKLRAENEAMATELAALTPAFFEEIEDLKYAHAMAREQLELYASRFGPLQEG